MIHYMFRQSDLHGSCLTLFFFVSGVWSVINSSGVNGSRFQISLMQQMPFGTSSWPSPASLGLAHQPHTLPLESKGTLLMQQDRAPATAPEPCYFIFRISATLSVT